MEYRHRFGVIVAARTGSTRLPGKALLPLADVPMIVYLLRRLLPSRRASKIVFATTTLAEDDALADVAKEEGVDVFRGANEDVVGRFVEVARAHQMQYVVRVTGDCPFLHSEVLDYVIAHCEAIEGEFDLVTTKGAFPKGIDLEVYPADLMARLHVSGQLDAADREHLVKVFYDRPSSYRINVVEPPPEWAPRDDRTFTVDTLEDFESACAITEVLPLAQVHSAGIGAILESRI